MGRRICGGGKRKEKNGDWEKLEKNSEQEKRA